MPQNVHAVVGTGDSSESGIVESLRDVLAEGDAVNIVWEGRPPASVEAVYDYITDNEIEFTIFYSDGAKVPGIFRNSEHGTVQKSRDPISKAAAEVANKGKILVLWDDDEAEVLVNKVAEAADPKTLILDLSNGLVPITLEDPDEAPAPSSKYDDADHAEVEEASEPEAEETAPDPEEEEDPQFTRDELENMTAAAVKRYGAHKGVESATKKGIIDELFPEEVEASESDEKEDSPDPATRPVVNAEPRTNMVASHQLMRRLNALKVTEEGQEQMDRLRTLAMKFGDAIIESQDDSRERDLSQARLEETLMWAIKGVSLTHEAPRD